MTFTLNAEVAAVVAAAIERSGPPPAPPVGDVASRRVALDAMLRYFNNEAQPVASKVDTSDHSVITPDGATLLARWYRQPTSGSATRTSVTRSHLVKRACRSNCTCTPACRTSTTPSPPRPTCRAVRKVIATACCGACDQINQRTIGRHPARLVGHPPPRRAVPPGAAPTSDFTRRAPASRSGRTAC